jgi:hypothetical protein
MKIKMPRLKRSAYLALALALSVAGLFPILKGKAYAYTQLTARSVEMSSSASGATSTTYLVTFTATTAAKNVRIDFCVNSPLYTDSCTAPTGFSASSAALVDGTQVTAANGWTVASSAASQVTISSATAYSAGVVSYALTGITNPTTIGGNPTGTFYARIYTYVAQTNDYTSAAAPGTVADFGGIALSTANLISITAKVQETLTFCVSGSALQPTNLTCTSATTPTLTLGHGTPAVLDQTAVDTANAYTQVSTNASGGVSMRMKSSNSCTNGGLSSNGGSTCNIPGVPSGTPAGSTAQAITAGTAAFGLYVDGSNTNATGTGTITPDANYHNNSHVTIPSDLWYGMDQGASGVTSTYGDVVAASTAPLSLVNNQLVFAATASLTTQAGIYTVNESIITTGTF